MNNSPIAGISLSTLIVAAGLVLASAQFAHGQEDNIEKQGAAVLQKIAAEKQAAILEEQAAGDGLAQSARLAPAADDLTQTSENESVKSADVEPATVSAQTDISQSADLSRFAYHPESSSISVNYEDYIRFMNSYSLVHKNRVKLDYSLIKTAGARKLIQHIQYLKDLPVDQLSRNDQLAYWLNLRNLLVIFAIAVDGSTEISEERGTFDEPGEMWTKKMVMVNDVNLSINDIEKDIILANWKDPNIVYGLYQGVDGAPPLYKPGFRGENVRDVLPKLGKRYLNEKGVVKIKANQAQIPQVYGWYREALFKDDDKKIVKHLRRLAKESQFKKLEPVNSIEMDKLSYNIDAIGKLKKKKKRNTQRRAPQAPTPGPSSGSSGGGGRSGS